jgi:hypothetical protein
MSIWANLKKKNSCSKKWNNNKRQKITSKKNDNTIASNKFKNSSSISGNSSKCKSTPKKNPNLSNPSGKQLLLRIRIASRSA